MSGIAGDRTSVVIVRWDNEHLIPSSVENRSVDKFYVISEEMKGKVDSCRVNLGNWERWLE